VKKLICAFIVGVFVGLIGFGYAPLRATGTSTEFKAFMGITQAQEDSALVALGFHQGLARSATTYEMRDEFQSRINEWWQKHQDASGISGKNKTIWP